MLLRSATFHNMHWRDFKLDVGELRGLIALVAPNGTGKSSAIELGILGSCFRKTETQGKLKDRAIDRDAWVEASIVHGAGYTIRQLVDGKTGESLVTNDNGEPVLHDTKVSTYESEFAAKRLPDPEVYLAGPFCAQQSEGFVKMTSAERISVILKVRGIARLERMAKLAANRATLASDAFQALVTRIADARSGALAVDAAVAACDAAQQTAGAAAADVTIAKDRLEPLRQEAADHAVRKAERGAAEKLIETLQEQAKGAAERRVDAERRIEGNRQIQADADMIRAAAAGLEAANAELTRLELALVEADKQIAGLLDPWRDGAARAKAALSRRTQAQARLNDKSAVEAAIAGKGDLSAAATAAADVVVSTDAELAALTSQQIAGVTERNLALREGHDRILRSEPEGSHAISAESLATDDASAKAAVEVPRRAKELAERLRDERDRAAVAARALADADKLAARADDIESAQVDFEAYEKEGVEILTGHGLAVVTAVLRAIGRRETAVAAKVQATMLEPMRKLAGRLPALDDSDRRLVELREALASAQAEEARLQQQAAAVDLIEIGAPPNVTAAESALAAAEAASRTAEVTAIKAQEARARAREADERAAKLETERDAVAAELRDWTRIEIDLGRKGIQSAEVDAAGPELTELSNSLLRKCHGPRFTVEVKTQRLNADGKKTIDECHVRVIDSVKGTDKELRDHSGGERVILGITIRLALSMMACRTADLRDFTFVCDEGGAALDPENNRAFVAMLRHALAATGARHVLLVSHSEEVQRMCDHIIAIPAAA